MVNLSTTAMGGIATVEAGWQHPKMNEPAKLKLSRLRDIGWSIWDPIGLREISRGCADEYDGYLLQVVSRLRGGEPASKVAAYLEDSETGHMGLTPNETMRSRAEATVAAIREYLETVPPAPLKVR